MRGQSLSSKIEKVLDDISMLIGKRLVGVAVSMYTLELVFEDCSVVVLNPMSDTLVDTGRLSREECGCLEECLADHGVGNEAVQECMDSCLEKVYQGSD